jgi:hypothetical protein
MSLLQDGPSLALHGVAHRNFMRPTSGITGLLFGVTSAAAQRLNENLLIDSSWISLVVQR